MIAAVPGRRQRDASLEDCRVSRWFAVEYLADALIRKERHVTGRPADVGYPIRGLAWTWRKFWELGILETMGQSVLLDRFRHSLPTPALA